VFFAESRPECKKSGSFKMNCNAAVRLNRLATKRRFLKSVRTEQVEV
jgi:hypothetical protein